MPKSITKHRLTAFERQNGRCHYCGLPMWNKQPTELTAKYRITEGEASRLRCTAEHLVAKQDGGTDSKDNIVAACQFCNWTRHSIPSQPNPTNYRKRVGRRIRAGKWHPRNVLNLMAITA